MSRTIKQGDYHRRSAKDELREQANLLRFRQALQREPATSAVTPFEGGQDSYQKAASFFAPVYQQRLDQDDKALDLMADTLRTTEDLPQAVLAAFHDGQGGEITIDEKPAPVTVSNDEVNAFLSPAKIVPRATSGLEDDIQRAQTVLSRSASGLTYGAADDRQDRFNSVAANLEAQTADHTSADARHVQAIDMLMDNILDWDNAPFRKQSDLTVLSFLRLSRMLKRNLESACPSFVRDDQPFMTLGSIILGAFPVLAVRSWMRDPDNVQKLTKNLADAFLCAQNGNRDYLARMARLAVTSIMNGLLNWDHHHHYHGQAMTVEDFRNLAANVRSNLEELCPDSVQDGRNGFSRLAADTFDAYHTLATNGWLGDLTHIQAVTQKLVVAFLIAQNGDRKPLEQQRDALVQSCAWHEAHAYDVRPVAVPLRTTAQILDAQQGRSVRIPPAPR